MTQADRAGEVVAAETTAFTAQCYELYQSPPLGSMVKVSLDNTEIYALVYHAITSGLEPGRRPIARGRELESTDDVYKESPQLAKLLRSEFTALVIGHREDGVIHHYLPPRPARIHSFVYTCPQEAVRQFSQDLSFLSILAEAHLPIPPEELIGAALRQMSQTHQDPRAFLVKAGRELALRLSDDPNQLKAVLERIRP